MKQINVTRTAEVPDLLRVSRYEKAPEYGPRILFFSGGTALNETSRVLKKFTHNSIHMVTPFDSGGSSAVLRQAFDMPAIGDMRSRMMALADERISGHPEVFQLFAHRLPKDKKQSELLTQLKSFADGKDARVAAIKNPMRRLIRNHLTMFVEAMPSDFDLRGASIGNLILAAGYLNNDQQLDPVLFMFSRLVNVLGQVCPIVNDNLHLSATLEDGSTITGQHLMTGKEVGPLHSPVTDFKLVSCLELATPAVATLPKKRRKLIEAADLICYPPGSFYSSILANLLPTGVSQAISKANCPKVYAPGLGDDPERIGLSLDKSIFKLIDFAMTDLDGAKISDVLNFVLIDSENGEGLRPSTVKSLRKDGVQVIDTRLVTPQSKPYYDPQLLVMALLSLT